MTYFIEDQPSVLVQGITGSTARFHLQEMIDYGTKVVAGVTPYKGGTTVGKIPVYHTVKEALNKHYVNTTLIFVPAPFAKDAILEALESNIPLIVVITEHIPLLDMAMIHDALKTSTSRLIGPNCPGLLVPDAYKIGIMPANIFKRGKVGIVSRSGTLTYEAVSQLTEQGIGQSIAVGIGGDSIRGIDFIDVLQELNQDIETEVILLIGEIGSNSESKAAKWIQHHCVKPVVAFVSGRTAPEGRSMGHAGAMISSESDTAIAKIQALKHAGATIVENPANIGVTVARVLKEEGKIVK